MSVGERQQGITHNSQYTHSIDYDQFYEWFAGLPCPAYLSSYEAPFEVVAEFDHISLIDSRSNSDRVTERLFYNGFLEK